MKRRNLVILLGVAFMLWFTGCKSQVETGKRAVSSRKATGAAGELKISYIVFCSEEPQGYMEYTEQPEAPYETGDVVWIYCNLEGVKYNLNPDSSQEVWITSNLKILSADGEVLLDQEVLNEH